MDNKYLKDLEQYVEAQSQHEYAAAIWIGIAGISIGLAIAFMLITALVWWS